MAVKTIDLQPKIDTATPTQFYLADSHSEIPSTGNPGDMALCLDCGDRFTFLSGFPQPIDQNEGLVRQEDFDALKRKFEALIFMLGAQGLDLSEDILEENVL